MKAERPAAEQLLDAAAVGKFPGVKKALQRGASINVTGGRQSRTALHHAAAGGRLQVVQFLLDAGADPGVCTTRGSTAVHLAAQGGHAPVAAALLSKGASFTAVDSQGHTPMHVAARSGSTAVIKVLLEAGASLDAADPNSWTPFHWACSCGKHEAASMLLAAGADVGAVDSQGRTPLHLACSKGHSAVLGVLVAAGAALDAKDGEDRTPLRTACEEGHEQLVGELLGAGARADIPDSAGCLALHAASSRARVAVLRLLLQSSQVRAHVDAPTTAGDTALQLACRAGHAEVAQMLVSAGADPNAMRGGMTPLHEVLEKAARRHMGPPKPVGEGHMSCLRVLLAAGADADQQYGAGAVTADGTSLQGVMPMQRAHQLGNHAAVLWLATPENLRHLSAVPAQQEHQEQQQQQLGGAVVAPADVAGVIAASLYNLLPAEGGDSAGMQGLAVSTMKTMLETLGLAETTALVERLLGMCRNIRDVAKGSRCAMQLLKVVHSGWLAGARPLLKQLWLGNRLEQLVVQPLLRQQRQGGEGVSTTACATSEPAEGATEEARMLWARAQAAAQEGQWQQVIQLVQQVTGLHPSFAQSSLYELAKQGRRYLSGVAGLCGALLAAWWGFLQGQGQHAATAQSQQQARQKMANAVVTAAQAFQQLRRGPHS